jgi:hypothetical protein
LTLAWSILLIGLILFGATIGLIIGIIVLFLIHDPRKNLLEIGFS